jgi:nicotinamidase-related amidase
MSLDRHQSVLLMVDFQTRLMPAIHEGRAVLERASLLAEAAKQLGVPIVATEQNAAGLGPTVAELQAYAGTPVAKRHFDACREPNLLAALPAGRPCIVAMGCETHVCFMQTVLGLLAQDRMVFVAADAVGSRRPADKSSALARMARAGAELVTAEMVVFEWLAHCDDPAFRSMLALIKPL